ncbi:GNAT family N-acetyltransferase [Paenibacillus sp. IB182496]|uniref:GNAT family N-acetyltransferase n=2 Tax=Paenibacillus sabuli TaxID=2772509 RepID=A0A927GQC9_9BACL|nr:GNAT family N-acetyltransferase [Paenibacillus sabuli]
MPPVPLSRAHVPEACRLWNASELGEAFPMRERLLRQSWHDDPNLLQEGTLAVCGPNGELIAFVVAKLWQDGAGYPDAEGRFPADQGWIHALLVARDWRGRGIGGRLLELAEQALRARGARTVDLGNDLHKRLFPGLPGAPEPDAAVRKWFEARGYAPCGELRDMQRSYGAGEPVAPYTPEGVTVRLATRADSARLTAFMARCFPGRWDYAARQYWQDGGTGREYVLMEEAGEIIGFCRINDGQSPVLAQNVYWAPLFASELGGVGPLGLDEACRGRGYGAKLVLAGISMLRRRGISEIVIDATPIADFYAKLGYAPWRRYILMRKAL